MCDNVVRPEDSSFRRWFRDCLQELGGNTLEWPVLMRHIFDEEFQRLRASDQYYAGEVFLNRDDKVQQYQGRDSQDEEILVYRLYGAVHEQSQGVLTIGDDRIWLFSCQVPNQGMQLSYRTRSRKADLIGLREDGSLVVFECKGPENRSDSPFYGLLEGLDYLGCLLTEHNLSCLDEGLQNWLVDYGDPADGFSYVEPGWPSVAIVPKARHSVIVLAPQAYYNIHLAPRNNQPPNWWLLSDHFLSDVFENFLPGVDFAVVDYDSGQATWLESDAFKSPPSKPPGVTTGVPPEEWPRRLIWSTGEKEVVVTKVRRGGKNTRIRLPDGTTIVVPNGTLRPAP